MAESLGTTREVIVALTDRQNLFRAYPTAVRFMIPGHGTLTAEELRWIADELDDRNSMWMIARTANTDELWNGQRWIGPEDFRNGPSPCVAAWSEKEDYSLPEGGEWRSAASPWGKAMWSMIPKE